MILRKVRFKLPRIMACLARVKRILERDIPNGMEVSGTLKLLIRNLKKQIRLFFKI